MIILVKREIAAAGFSLLFLCSGCEPLTADSLVDFAGDFVRSLIAALWF